MLDALTDPVALQAMYSDDLLSVRRLLDEARERLDTEVRRRRKAGHLTDDQANGLLRRYAPAWSGESGVAPLGRHRIHIWAMPPGTMGAPVGAIYWNRRGQISRLSTIPDRPLGPFYSFDRQESLDDAAALDALLISVRVVVEPEPPEAAEEVTAQP